MKEHHARHAPAIDVLTGPAWFFDPALQPGGRNLLWTVQLDVDVPWLRSK